MKKVIAILLIISIFVGNNIASGETAFSFDQIVGFIDSMQIDGTTVFGKKTEGSLPSSNREDFFTMQGAALTWMSDVNQGNFAFFDNDSQRLYLWSSNNSAYIRNIFSILHSFLDDYINYSIGGKMTLIITTSNAYNVPYVKIEYSPKINSVHKTDSAEYNEYYDNYEDFSSAVDRWFGIVLDGKSVETVQTTELKRGSKGEDVMKLQTRLNELGHDVGSIDGDYGRRTEEAVKQFQIDNKLAPTGIADVKTQEVLYSDIAVTKEDASLRRGLEELADALSELDVNGDGKISSDEMFEH